MKYMPLDLSVMDPEPFPYSVWMRSDLHPKSQVAGQGGWKNRMASVRDTLRGLTRSCWKKTRRKKVVVSVFSTVGACLLGLLAVGVFWLAVEMDNSDLQTSRSSCSIRP